MSPFDLIDLLLPSSFAMMAVVGLVIVFVLHNPRPRGPVAASSGPGRYLPLGAPGAPPSNWQARIAQQASFPSWRDGSLVLRDGMLSFIPEGPDGSDPAATEWTFPIRSVVAQYHSPFARPFVRHGNVLLWLPDGQAIEAIVSTARINRYINNGWKQLTENGHAHTFLTIFTGNGGAIGQRRALSR